MVKNGAEILIDALVEQGVDTIFRLSRRCGFGTSMTHFTKTATAFDIFLTAHEQGAAHAADGYARATGKGRRLPGNERTGCDQPRNRYCYRVYGFHPDGCHHRQRRHQPHRP